MARKYPDRPSSKRLTIDTLKQNTFVTDDQLDCTIQEKYLLKLSEHFGNCEKYLGDPGLELSEAQKADVRDCAFKDGYQMGMFKALKYWRRRNPYETYETLVQIFLELEDGLLAVKLCEIVAQIRVDPYPPSREVQRREMDQLPRREMDQLPDQLRTMQLGGRAQLQPMQGFYPPQGQGVPATTMVPVYYQQAQAAPPLPYQQYQQYQPPSPLAAPSFSFNWRKCSVRPRASVDSCTPVALNGKLYVRGRCAGLDVVLEYTPTYDRWTDLPYPGRRGYTMTTLSGQLLAVGGVNDGKASKTISTFNHRSKEWVKFYPSLPKAAQSPAVARYHDHLIVAGGCKADGSSLVHVNILDTSSNKWITAESLPSKGAYKSVLIGDTMYLVAVAGDSRSVLRGHIPSLVNQAGRARTKIWESLPDAPFFGSTPIAVGYSLLTVGGATDKYHTEPTTSIQHFDPYRNQWKEVGDLPKPMLFCVCTYLCGQLYVLGGNSGLYGNTIIGAYATELFKV